MAIKKTMVKKTQEKSRVAAKKSVAVKTKPIARSAPAVREKPDGPTARNCPLVLDGELDAEGFSPNACLTCDEFDCRFCEAAMGSGALRSRLFVGGEDGEEDDAGWDDEADVDEVSTEEPVEGDDDDTF